MVKLTRKSDRRNIVAGRRTFFAGSKTYMDRPVFRAQNEAELFIEVLRTNTLAGKFKLHEFVVMPDHFHVLLTVDGNTSIERALQVPPVQLTPGPDRLRRLAEHQASAPQPVIAVLRGTPPAPENLPHGRG